MIQIQGLNKRYGSNEVLRDVNLDFKGPGITAILGPNGSGKTTLVKCILGLVYPQKGKIEFEGSSVKNEHLYRAKISHVSQIARFPENLTGRELIKMFKDLRPGAVRDQFFIDLFSLEPELDKKIANLSGGTIQKLNILLALMYDAPLILLDEPTTGLDPVSLIRLKNFLMEEKAGGKLILITTHIMSLVEELADHIVFLLNGEVYFNGSKSELVKGLNKDNLEETIAAILLQKSIFKA